MVSVAHVDDIIIMWNRVRPPIFDSDFNLFHNFGMRLNEHLKKNPNANELEPMKILDPKIASPI